MGARAGPSSPPPPRVTNSAPFLDRAFYFANLDLRRAASELLPPLPLLVVVDSDTSWGVSRASGRRPTFSRGALLLVFIFFRILSEMMRIPAISLACSNSSAALAGGSLPSGCWKWKWGVRVRWQQGQWQIMGSCGRCSLRCSRVGRLLEIEAGPDAGVTEEEAEAERCGASGEILMR